MTHQIAASALAIMLTLGGAAWAQTQGQNDQDHEAHHPPAAQASPAVPALPQAPGGGGSQAAPQGMPMQGMMPGMMGSRQSGVMGGDMGRMMQMMQQRLMSDGMMGGPGATRPFERIEGQLAYFRTELRITDAQAPQWNAFADAVRESANSLRQAYAEATQGAAQPTTAPAQLERRVALLSAQLEATRAVAAAAGPLYAVLSEEQKRSADELMAEHLRGMRMRGM